jgi:hypothetical protein
MTTRWPGWASISALRIGLEYRRVGEALTEYAALSVVSLRIHCLLYDGDFVFVQHRPVAAMA